MYDLGIDQAKAKFDACLLADSKEHRKVFANTKDGFAKLVEWLKDKCPSVDEVHVCVESTGRYWEPLAEFLHSQGIKISVVNPVKIKGYAQSELKRSKTDAIDAGLIARFCQMHKPEGWQAPPEENKSIRDRQRYIDALKQQHTQETNRLQSGRLDIEVEKAILKHLEYLKEQIKELEKGLSKFVKSNQKLEHEVKLLTSIAGVGEQTAITFIGELYSIERFAKAKDVETFCGLDPRVFQSGTSVKGRTRISKVGNSRVRKALYMPALSALRANPILKEFGDRLRKAGKPGKVVVCAVMRKLLRIMFAVLKSGKPFDAEFKPRRPQALPC